ncbi:MAG: VCBS repeat-containing protein [Planctomycetes bacterium]|nr:VCBS repeat-containing protein [Planctomycetota bacterium]
MKHLTRTLSAIGLLAAAAAASDSFAVPLVLQQNQDLGTDGKDTRVIISTDIDGDGDLDVFIGNWGQDNIVYRNRGNASFETVPPQAINNDGGFTFDAAWGDMDGDGDQDLAVANGQGTNNGLYENLHGKIPQATEGRFEKVTTGPVVTDGGETYGVAWGDVDNDGDLDLAFANKLSPNLLYLNDGVGHFTKVTTGPQSTDVGPSRDAKFADLDGDGDVDLMFANSNDTPNFVYFNQGGLQGGSVGQFVRHTGDALATDAHASRDMSANDWDGDGDLDLFVCNEGDESNDVYLNDGDGTFTKLTGIAAASDGGKSFAAAWGDVDGDGDDDLFVANREESDFMYMNVGGTLQKVTGHPVVQTVGNSRHAQFADFDQDGSCDLVVANTIGEDNLFWRNSKSPWTNLGHNYPSSDYHALLSGSGTLEPAKVATYYVDGAPPSAQAFWVIGTSEIDAPFRGGTLVPAPDVVVAGLATKPSGKLDFAIKWPATLPSGLVLYHQFWFLDASSPTGFSSSNGMAGTNP